MYIKFWGTRGSIPSPLNSQAIQDKIRQALKGAAGLNLWDNDVIERYLSRLPQQIGGTVGGNTPCLEIQTGDQLLVLDAGSGIRDLGLELLQRGFAHGHHRLDILITHTHWDHIQGFPFFRPAFVKHNHLVFHSPFPDLAERLARQQDQAFFPVPTTYMSAQIDFKVLPENTWTQIGHIRVYPMRLSHPGLAYGYRIEDEHSSMVWASDSEYKRLDPESTRRYIEFFAETDLLVFDAQYSLTEALDRLDWGHSNAIMGAEFAHRARARRLLLCHHDPTSTDEKIWSYKEQAEAYLAHHPQEPPCEVMVAYDGLSLTF